MLRYPNNLRFYRLKRKLTQKEVIDHLGYRSANRLSTWENGTASPSIENIMKLSILYKVPIDKLLAQMKRKMIRKKPQKKLLRLKTGFNNPYEGMNKDELIEELAEFIIQAYLKNKHQEM